MTRPYRVPSDFYMTGLDTLGGARLVTRECATPHCGISWGVYHPPGSERYPDWGDFPFCAEHGTFAAYRKTLTNIAKESVGGPRWETPPLEKLQEVERRVDAMRWWDVWPKGTAAVAAEMRRCGLPDTYPSSPGNLRNLRLKRRMRFPDGDWFDGIYELWFAHRDDSSSKVYFGAVGDGVGFWKHFKAHLKPGAVVAKAVARGYAPVAVKRIPIYDDIPLEEAKAKIIHAHPDPGEMLNWMHVGARQEGCVPCEGYGLE